MPSQNSPLHNRVQAFPLTNGRVNLTSGIYTGSVIYCATDGSFDLTFNKETEPVTIAMIEGGVFAIPVGSKIDLTDTTGKFHISR